MKKQRCNLEEHVDINPFDFLSEEIVFAILDRLSDNPFDKKSFSLVCKSFYGIESRHRKTLKPLRSEYLLKVLSRYPFVTELDLTFCPRIPDGSLSYISNSCNTMLRSIDLSRSRFFTHVGLANLGANCPNLVEIDLSNAVDLTDAAALAVAQAKNLERLSLVRCKSITDMGIGCIAVGCRKLRVVNLKWCLSVGDLGVALIAVKCKEIRSLDLSHLQISEKCLPPIMKLQHLERLVLEECLGIDDDSLAAIKQGSKSLKTLDLSRCENISSAGLSYLSSRCISLQNLILANGSPVTNALADSLQKVSTLQSIKLDNCSITRSGLKAIGNLYISLRELSLSKCSEVTDEGLASVVAKHKDLRKLDITCCRKITDVSISNITNSCSLLTSLKMESCTLVSAKAFVLIGKNCLYLEELDLTDNEVDDEGLKSISRCSRLAVLKLGICLNITDQGLAHIGIGCPKLIELDLYRCAGIMDAGISAVARGCTDLEMINLSYLENITDSCLRSLSKCSKLSIFESRGCPLITFSGLAAIAAGCRQLTKLDIKKCQRIDDSGMIPLARFSQNLRLINLSYTSVTDVGLLSLASISCLQNMTILHVNGLTRSGLVAALLACGGLTKVKLQTSFRSLIPRPVIEHLEARGCVLSWRDKVFQAELDPKCWKLLAEDVE